jgi:hypothetical protein
MKGMTERRRVVSIAALALLMAVGGRVYGQGQGAAQGTAAGNSQGADGGTFYTPLSKKAQADLGDIHPASASSILSYFHGQASVNMQYTSNAPLYHSKDEADFLIVPTLEGSASFPLNKLFKVNVEARLEDYTYASHQSLGFWGGSGEAQLEYRYKPTWPRFYVGTEPYYYLSYDTGDRLTSAIGPVAGVDQTLSINRGKTLLLLAYHYGHYYASPSIDTRDSQTVTIALTQQIKPDIYAQLYWQYQFSKYTIDGRDENRDVLGISFIHQFTPQTFLSLFANYVDNASNNSLAKYTTVNVGLSMVYQY